MIKLTGLLESKLGDEPDQLPTTWNPSTRDVALLLAEFSLKYLNEPPDKIARMLESAISSIQEPNATPASDRGWLANANAWLVIAKAASDSSAQQVTQQLQQINTAQAWGELMEGLKLLATQADDSADRQRLNDIQLAAANKLKSQMEHLSPQQQLQWSLAEATALLDSGETETAIELLQNLVAEQPNSSLIQIAYAKALSQSNNKADVKNAISRWRLIAVRSRPHSINWFTAKYNIADLLFKTGNTKEARTFLEYLQANPPGWKNSSLATNFNELLRKVIAADR